jgi:DNA-directed RNA polymerase I subunit RPA43
MPNDDQFQVATTSLVLSVPPIFARNPRGGVEEILDSMVMRYLLHSTLPSKLSTNSVRYVPALQGVVLSHSNLKFLNNTATIRGDSPFLVCTVVFDATVWSPRVGIKLCTFLFCFVFLQQPTWI